MPLLPLLSFSQSIRQVLRGTDGSKPFRRIIRASAAANKHVSQDSTTVILLD